MDSIKWYVFSYYCIYFTSLIIYQIFIKFYQIFVKVNMLSLIMKIPTTNLGYDYTYKVGKNIYDTVDCNVIEYIENLHKTQEIEEQFEHENFYEMIKDSSQIAEEESKQEEVEEKAAQNEEVEEDDEISNAPRVKRCKLDIGMLEVLTDREFCISFTPTPGLK